jgi:hypothetical protein
MCNFLIHPACPPNQSLKLTEIAVDDFARADWIPSLRHFVAAA